MDMDVSSTLSFKMESVEHIKVVLSYYANSMKTNDGFCLDYSTTTAADNDNDDWQSITANRFRVYSVRRDSTAGV